MITDEQAQAIATAERAVEHEPNNFECHSALGWAYFQAERLNEAMEAFQRAVALNPNAAGAFNGIGRVYERLGPTQAALAAYEHAIALDPQAIAPYVGLGIIYFDQIFDYEAAIKAFQRGLAHQPEDAFAIGLLGVTYARMGQFDEAISALQQAIHLQPDDAFAYGNLSILYLHRKQYDEMIGCCERELAIADGYDAHRLLAIAYDRLGRHEEAVHQLEQSITLNPQDYEARGLLAKLLRTVGRQQEADAQSASASEMAAQDNEYGQACFAAVSDNLDEALRLLKVALTKKQVQPGWARIDPELSSLIDDPRFKALIAINGRSAMSTEANKILVRRLIEEVWNTGNYDQLDGLAAPAFAESTKRLNQMTRTAFPDCHDTIEDMIAEGDKVVVRWTARGTHLGEWPAPWGAIPPTGKPVTFSAIHIFRIADGKIVDRWVQVDTLGILQQVDALPAQ